MKKHFSPLTVFWVLVAVFIFFTATILIESFRESLFIIIPGPFFVPLILTLLLILSILLIVITPKSTIHEKLKKFLLLTGASVAGFAVFSFLHNLFYGLGMLASHLTVLSYLMEVLHVGCFIISIFICPLGFLIGIIGTIVLLIKK